MATMPAYTFIIGSYILECDDCYKNYIIMLKIVNYLSSPDISKDGSYLKVLIENHHTAFHDLYPQSIVIPKMD